MRSPAEIIDCLRREAQENNHGDLMLAAAVMIDDLCGKLGAQDVAVVRAEIERDRHARGAEGYRSELDSVKASLGLLGGGIGLSVVHYVDEQIAKTNEVLLALKEALDQWEALRPAYETEYPGHIERIAELRAKLLGGGT